LPWGIFRIAASTRWRLRENESGRNSFAAARRDSSLIFFFTARFFHSPTSRAVQPSDITSAFAASHARRAVSIEHETIPHQAELGRLAKGLDGRLFGIVNFKHREQLGHLQQIVNALGQVGELDAAARILRCGVERHQRSQSARIDVIHFAQVEHDPVVLRNRLFNRIPKQSRLLAEYNAAAAIDNQNPIFRFR
jgi:hypothetical protein